MEDFDTITTLELSHIATPEKAPLNLPRLLPLLALDLDGDTDISPPLFSIRCLLLECLEDLAQ